MRAIFDITFNQLASVNKNCQRILVYSPNTDKPKHTDEGFAQSFDFITSSMFHQQKNTHK
jgi:hypothetical protein